MNFEKASKPAWPTLVVVILVFVCATASAQSTDRDNPAPLGAGEIKGSGVGKNEDHWYTFLAGPGDIAITLDVQARSGGTVTYVRLYDFDANEIVKVNRSAFTDRTERAVKRLSIPRQQPLLMRIEIDRETGPFMVRVQGAVTLSGADQSFAPSATDPSAGANPTPATTDPAIAAAPPTSAPLTSTGVLPPATTDPPITAASTTAATTPLVADTAVPSGVAKPSGLQRFWMRLGTAGELLGATSLGSLRLEMKDGTSQDISLLKVAKMAIARPGDGLPEETSGDKPTGWKKFWLPLGGAGELTGLGGAGSLRITMRDGTAQDISLAKIKKASFKK